MAKRSFCLEATNLRYTASVAISLLNRAAFPYFPVDIERVRESPMRDFG